MSKKKRVRERFRESTFKRDGERCRVCGLRGVDRQTLRSGEGRSVLNPLDAHHITDRNLMPNGGYVVANGISLCTECHLRAENKALGFEPEILYGLIGSSLKKAIAESERLG